MGVLESRAPAAGYQIAARIAEANVPGLGHFVRARFTEWADHVDAVVSSQLGVAWIRHESFCDSGCSLAAPGGPTNRERIGGGSGHFCLGKRLWAHAGDCVLVVEKLGFRNLIAGYGYGRLVLLGYRPATSRCW